MDFSYWHDIVLSGSSSGSVYASNLSPFYENGSVKTRKSTTQIFSISPMVEDLENPLAPCTRVKFNEPYVMGFEAKVFFLSFPKERKKQIQATKNQTVFFSCSFSHLFLLFGQESAATAKIEPEDNENEADEAPAVKPRPFSCPEIAVTSVAWNPHQHSKGWYAAGMAAGYVRIQQFSQ